MALRMLLHGVFAMVLMVGSYWPVLNSQPKSTERERIVANPLSPLAGPPPRVHGIYDVDPLEVAGVIEEKPLIYRIGLEQWRPRQ